MKLNDKQRDEIFKISNVLNCDSKSVDSLYGHTVQYPRIDAKWMKEQTDYLIESLQDSIKGLKKLRKTFKD